MGQWRLHIQASSLICVVVAKPQMDAYTGRRDALHVVTPIGFPLSRPSLSRRFFAPRALDNALTVLEQQSIPEPAVRFQLRLFQRLPHQLRRLLHSIDNDNSFKALTAYVAAVSGSEKNYVVVDYQDYRNQGDWHKEQILFGSKSDLNTTVALGQNTVWFWIDRLKNGRLFEEKPPVIDGGRARSRMVQIYVYRPDRFPHLKRDPMLDTALPVRITPTMPKSTRMLIANGTAYSRIVFRANGNPPVVQTKLELAERLKQNEAVIEVNSANASLYDTARLVINSGLCNFIPDHWQRMPASAGGNLAAAVKLLNAAQLLEMLRSYMVDGAQYIPCKFNKGWLTSKLAAAPHNTRKQTLEACLLEVYNYAYK